MVRILPQDRQKRRSSYFSRCEFLDKKESEGGCFLTFYDDKELDGGRFPMGFSETRNRRRAFSHEPRENRGPYIADPPENGAGTFLGSIKQGWWSVEREKWAKAGEGSVSSEAEDEETRRAFCVRFFMNKK